MELTAENKAHVDSMTYAQLLQKWHFSPAGNEWFQGQTGEYWGRRMSELKNADPGGAVAASKWVGWACSSCDATGWR